MPSLAVDLIEVQYVRFDIAFAYLSGGAYVPHRDVVRQILRNKACDGVPELVIDGNIDELRTGNSEEQGE